VIDAVATERLLEGKDIWTLRTVRVD